MKTVILCGGKGTRLREETEFRPKPMIPIGERPILWHIMKIFRHHGYSDFILPLGYKGAMIKEYFRNYQWNTADLIMNFAGSWRSVHFHDPIEDQASWWITFAETGLESGTGNRLRQVRKYLREGERFFLTYGDGLADIDLHALLESHKKSGKLCTITAVHPPGRFGALHFQDGQLKSFAEKAPTDEWINGGFMVCEYGVFDYLTDDEWLMFERSPLGSMAASGQVNAHLHEGFWQCMDTPQEMQYLNDLWKTKPPWKVW